MKMACPSCGQWLEIPGRAATCPNCGSLVTIPVAPPLPAPSQFRDQPGTTYERPRRYQPSPQADDQPLLPPWARALIIIGCVGLLAFIIIEATIYGVKSRFATKTPTSGPTVAPAPAPAPAPRPQKAPSIFSEQPQNPTPTVEPAPPPPPSPPPTPVPTTPTTVASTAPLFHPTTAPAPKEETVTDEAINAAIAKGVDNLVSHFENGKIKSDPGNTYVGTDALCVLALLHAGQAISDERLNIHNPFMSGALDALRSMTIVQGLETYTHSLRAQALAIYNRKEDRSVLDADVRWLVNAGVKGYYTYGKQPETATQPSQAAWDNSNSQYGALGVWAAAEAGVNIPPSYWVDIQSHWENTQGKDGGWEYGQGSTNGTLSMTAAGVNMLFVANEQLSALRPEMQVGRPPFSPNLQAGLDWLAKDDNCVKIGGYPFYTLYGMERAGLACGFKMFGTHDWFRDLAANTIKQQSPDGSWGTDADTAFALLFLSRGRHPLLMNKLHFVGAWANRPRDLARLTKFTSKETERPLNWQVVSLNTDWSQWLDAPILYIASHEAPIFNDEDYNKLRAFIMAGGLLFTQADGNSDQFNQWAEVMAIKLFPNGELKDLPREHYIYNLLFKPQENIPLRALGNGTRLLIVHSPTDLSKRWQVKDPKSDRPAFELGANVFVYATGMQVPRNRVDTLDVPDLPGKATNTIPIARLKYDGDWDPEPWSWVRTSRWFRRKTSIGLVPTPVKIEKLSVDIAPFAHLTGTAPFSLSETQTAALQKYVQDGGVLLIDACGGFLPVAQSIRANILARAFPGIEPAELKTDHPLIAGRGEGMEQLARAQVRPFALMKMGQKFTRPLLLESGKGAVLISDLDITSGLLGTNTFGILGYDPDYAQLLVKNAILWTVNGRGAVHAWGTPTTEAATPPATTAPSTP